MALHLTGANEKLQVVAGTAGSLRVTRSWTDAPSPITPSSNVTPSGVQAAVAITNTTPTDVVAAPGASTVRNVKELEVFNDSTTVTTTVLVQVTDSTNTQPKFFCTLAPSESAVFDETGLWTIYGSDGIAKSSPGSGRLLQSTLLTAASGTFTTTASTRRIIIRGVGGGGGGAGCTSVAAAASAGGGGAGGAYAEKTFVVNPSTGYAYTCGAAGAGASGAAGGNGGNSTFVVGVTTVTAPGGQGAPVATAVTTLSVYRGGLAGAVATNGDLNAGGEGGDNGIVVVVATPLGASGGGAPSVLGGGGSPISAVGNGNNATGFGAGGGGALTGASAVRTGGSGTAGCWVVDEYT